MNRTAIVPAVLSTAALLLSACGSGGSDTTPGGTGSTTAAAPSSSASATDSGSTSAGTSASGTASDSASATPSDTASGSSSDATSAAGGGGGPAIQTGEFRYGAKAVAGVKDYSDPKNPVPAEVTVTVAKGSAADLKGFKLPATLKDAVPYLVSYTVKNVGTKPADLDLAVELSARTASGGEAQHVSLIGAFPKCKRPEGSGDSQPGAAVSGCTVKMAPAKDPVVAVELDSGDGKITWK